MTVSESSNIKFCEDEYAKVSSALKNASSALDSCASSVPGAPSGSSGIGSRLASCRSQLRQVAETASRLARNVLQSVQLLNECETGLSSTGVGAASFTANIVSGTVGSNLGTSASIASPSGGNAADDLQAQLEYAWKWQSKGDGKKSNPVLNGTYRGEGYQFGRTELPTDGSGHSGIDISPSIGYSNPDVTAAFGGRVVKVVEGNTGYGNYVVVESVVDGVSYQTYYAHLMEDSISVKTGDVLDGGIVLGRMGMTGAATGVHLHFEIREFNNTTTQYTPVNPIPILDSYGIRF